MWSDMMRIAKIVRRSKLPRAPQVGFEAEKLFIEDRYEDGTSRKMVPIAIDEVFSGERQHQTRLREVVCKKSSPNLQNNYTIAVRYSSLSGYDQSEYVSVSGITAGLRFRNNGGRLIDDKGAIWYRPNSTGIHDSSGYAFVNQSTLLGIPPECVFQIIHETPQEFIIYCAGNEADGGCALVLLSKTNKSAVVLLNGQFSIHKLGKTKASANAGAEKSDQVLFLIMLNSKLGYYYWTGNWASEFSPKSALNGGEGGSRVLLCAFGNDNILGNQFGFRTRLVHKMGPGPRNSSYYAQSLMNQRFVVDADASLVELDVEGYVISFSFVAQDPELVAETELYNGSDSEKLVQLNDNLCLFRAIVAENLTVTKTRTMKLPIPADYLAATWRMYGYQNSNVWEIISLVSGKAFSVVEDQTRYVCLFMDDVGFEHYRTAGATSASYYEQRKQPSLQPVLLKIPVDESFLPIEGESPITHRFPVRFGANVREISMLLRKQNTELIIPSMMAHMLYAGISGENTVAIVDVISGTHKIVQLEPSPNTDLFAVMAVGVTDDRIILIDANDKIVILDDGPSASITLPGVVYEEDTFVTVVVDSPAYVTLYAFNGYFDNGTNTITVSVQDVLEVPVYAKKNLTVHVTKCVSLEVPSEEV